MRYSIRWLCLLGLVAFSHLSTAQQIPATILSAYRPMPVQYGGLGRGLSFDQFRLLELHRNGDWLTTLPDGIALPPVVVAYQTQSKQQLRFVLENKAQHQEAQVFALANLTLRGNALSNLDRILFPSRDTLRPKNNNTDVFVGAISLVGHSPTEPIWQFAVENAQQITKAPLRGTVSNGVQEIQFAEVIDDALSYADQGGMAAALLAAQVHHGFLFLHQGKVIAALSLTDLNRRSRNIFWLRKDLEPTLQTVVASMSTALLLRPDLK
ncbi:hypothetical protein [Hymenobacter fodinae]|uniref:Uncharacterized protein n=1 Tax=Hymenobacter fodinae TaxID=2510796 RepID=A0A4Z0P1G0_9BACT|nr:hypothetical protein [Hymenobacter fodinae]TGE04873.1 hypothetical protein EU556_22100 [Hymenobacter fodinae]